MSDTQKGNLYIFITAFLWSLGGIMLKYIHFSSLTTNGMRSLFAFLVFVIYRKSAKFKVNSIIFLAAICLTGTNLLFVFANHYTTAANAIVIQYTTPIWVLIWNSIYHKRMPVKSEVFSMIIAFVGTVLFFFDGLSTEYIIGNCMAIGSGLFFSGVFFLNALPKSSSEDSSMLAFLISFLISIPFIKEVVVSPSTTSMAGVIILGVFQVGLAYIFFSKGSRMTSPVTSSLIALLEAIMNPLWVYLFYGEKVGRFALIGAVLIIFAVITQILSAKNQTL